MANEEDGKDSKILRWESNHERHKMMNNIIRTSKEADLSLKQENHHDKTKKASTSSSSSLTAQWLRSKDPRIVRVSRAFGGKDRHSKVCTVRGLRDRRVRLSVSTAIQLYDLQERLGFNQPSKVVDWLLDAAKHKIDELPPLQIPPGSFSFCDQPSGSVTSMMNNNQVSTSQPNEEQGLNINESLHHLEGSNSIVTKSKGQVATGEEDVRDNVLTRRANNNPPPPHHRPSFLGLLNTTPLGCGVNNNQWEANSGHVFHSGNLGFANQTGLHSSNNVVPFSALSSTLSLSTGPITQPYFPSNIGAMDMDHQGQIDQYQMLSSSSNSLISPSVYTTSQSTKPFSLSMMMNPKLLRSLNSSGTQSRNKDQIFPSK